MRTSKPSSQPPRWKAQGKASTPAAIIELIVNMYPTIAPYFSFTSDKEMVRPGVNSCEYVDCTEELGKRDVIRDDSKPGDLLGDSAILLTKNPFEK